MIATNECACLTIESHMSHSKELITTLGPNVLDYINVIQKYLNCSSYEFIITSLKLMTFNVKLMNVDLPIDFVTNVFQPNSPCQKLRFLPSDNVQLELFSLHHSILHHAMAVKSVPILEEAYKCLLLNLQIAFSQLFNQKVNLFDENEENDNSKNSMNLNENEAILIIQSTLVSLAELANAKHSIIAMYALKPTFFELVVHKLDPANELLGKKYKMVQYSLLYILYSHCNKHGHFIASSSLITQSLSFSSNSFGSGFINAPSSNHLVKIIILLNKVLKNSELQKETRLLCVNWSLEIIKGAQNNLNFLCNSQEMIELINRIADLAFFNDDQVTLLSCSFIEVILQNVNDFNLQLPIQKYHQACKLLIGHTNLNIQQAYLNLMAILPPININEKKEINLQIANKNRDSFIYPEDVRTAINSLMRRDPSSSFTSLYFRSIISFILDKEQKEENDVQWLMRLFHCCMNEDNPIKIMNQVKNTHSQDLNQSDIIKIFDSNKSCLYFWSCWEVAQFCIMNKLRTPLGKPIDTLTKIESAIQFRVGQIYSNCGDCDDSMETKSNSAIQVRMLLLLIENLEKLIYNSNEGNSTRLFTTPKLIRTFFTNNKKSCIEWINRNRKSLMLIALKCGEPATVIRHGQELLRDMMNKTTTNSSEIEFIFLLIVEALIQLEVSDAAMGFYYWAAQELKLNYPWIKAAAEEANSRFENALNKYENELTKNSNQEDENINLNSNLNDFINNRIIQCYLNIGNLEEAINWSEQENVTLNQKLFTTNINLNYLNDLAVFPLNIEESNLKNCSALLSWDFNASFHEAQQSLLSICTSKYMNPEENHSSRLEALINDNISLLLNLPVWCSPAVENHFISSLHRTAIGIKHLMEGNGLKKLLFKNRFNYSYSNEDASILVNEIAWYKVYQNLANDMNGHSLVNDSMNELIFVAAKSARKQHNLRLSQNLLCQYAVKRCGLIGEEDCVVDSKVNDFTPLVSLINQAGIVQDQNEQLLKFQLEGAKLIHSFGDTRTAIDSLLNCTKNLIEKVDTKNDLSEMLSRSLLTLVKYLQSDPKYFELSHPTLSMIMNREIDDFSYHDGAIDQTEVLIGKLLLFSADSSKQLAKSLYELGAWSYRWGKKLTDLEEDKFDNRIISKKDNAFTFYKLSASSYFKFLQISNRTGCEDVNATLRLLRLILKHAPEMREILEEGLSKTPTEPWKNIILQLFSRLNHPEQYVRQSISDLLCRIGRDSPQLIIFPAVAGSLTNKKDGLIFEEDNFLTTNKSNEDEEFEDDEEIDDNEASIMQNCYSALLEMLSHHSPKLIQQTKIFVNELRRITVLWDEVWIGTLLNHLNEMKKQVFNLEAEIAKIQLNSLLNEEEKEMIIREKHGIMFKRIIYFLELTQLITSETPETKHETWFQSNFNDIISSTIKCLKSPNCPKQPQDSLASYQHLLHVLQKKSLVITSGRSQLVMDYISPVLTKMENTEIPMPGLNVHSENNNIITIQKVCKTVTTLHTKTKPKKIVFYGSDGKTYTYLFKGHEDLHLDERIMQFLSIVNRMLIKYHNGKKDKMLFCARHYSVTPLGNKSGLIQWVDGGQALYGFYKRWILNKDNNNDMKNKNQNINNENIYKPSEIFSKKLASKGITSSNRNDWSQKVLLQVHQELVQETPNDLIAKELWCSSINAYDYWRLTQNFIFSNAVMCMIGYIIGLGDRHLDNILLDLSTGEIIHIDYNICFEKGKTLRVPERVACRLTQNIVNGFGITKIEGTFRVSCEHVLRVLRKGKETLLTLLEAFVYDPLIDWTPGHEEGFTGAVYGGGRISELLKEGKVISKQQMEKENAEAMKRLNALIINIEKRSSWPSIDGSRKDFNQPDIQELKKIINETNNTKKLIGGSRSNDKNLVKSNIGIKRNSYATSVWKKIKLKVCFYISKLIS